jgi:hypothetical protein
MIAVMSALLLGAGAACLPAAAAADGRWRVRGAGIGTSAVWTTTDGGAWVSVHCDQGDPVLILRIDAGKGVRSPTQIMLRADGTGMEYPIARTDGHLASRIALDAPILDRMLVARRFDLATNGLTLATGAPGEPLARVVRACRALHWPRDARIDPSEAGFAKK